MLVPSAKAAQVTVGAHGATSPLAHGPKVPGPAGGAAALALLALGQAGPAVPGVLTLPGLPGAVALLRLPLPLSLPPLSQPAPAPACRPLPTTAFASLPPPRTLPQPATLLPPAALLRALLPCPPPWLAPSSAPWVFSALLFSCRKSEVTMRF